MNKLSKLHHIKQLKQETTCVNVLTLFDWTSILQCSMYFLANCCCYCLDIVAVDLNFPFRFRLNRWLLMKLSNKTASRSLPISTLSIKHSTICFTSCSLIILHRLCNVHSALILCFHFPKLLQLNQHPL